MRRLTGDATGTVRIRHRGDEAALRLPAGYRIQLDADLCPRGEPVPC
ncbi:hypothetical protein ACIRQQ_20725 [Streptomyces fuscichromogenes]